MARRNRAAAGDAGADDPGTSGALALDARSPEEADGPLTGPHDGEDLDPEITDAAGTVDFGAMRVPVPMRGTISVEPTANGRMQAVHIALPEGRLSVSALAAPKSSKLWPDLAREIDASLRDGGARVRSFPGVWGRELHATSGAATSVFVGVDGPRWMLYGVATGPTTHAESLDAELRRMLRGTVVERGRAPYPVRTVLPLVVPEHLAEAVAAATAAKKAEEAKKAARTGSNGQKAGKKKAGQKKAGQQKATSATAGQAAQQPAAGQPVEQQQAAAQQELAARQAAEQVAAQQAAEQVAEQVAEQQAAEQRAAAPRPAPHPRQPPAAQPTAAHPVPPLEEPLEEQLPTTPLREQSPSARRAAAAAWRARPAAAPRGDGTEHADAPPQWADPVSRISDPQDAAFGAEVDLDDPTEIWGPLPAEPDGTVEDRAAAGAGPASTASADAALDVPTEPWRYAVESATGGRRRLPEPDVAATGAGLPVAGAGVESPVTGTGGRRRLPEPDVAATGAGLPVAGAGAGVESPVTGTGRRRRLPEPDVAATGAGLPVAGAESPVTGTGGRRRLRESDVAETSGGLPVAGWGLGAGSDDRPVTSTGRRHLREPDPSTPAGRDGSTTTPWTFDTGVDAPRVNPVPSTRDLVPPEGVRPLSGYVTGVSADQTLASEGWQRELEDTATRLSRRRARRTLGAEYLIDTGEQEAVWTGSGPRHSPEPVTEPLPTLAAAAPAPAPAPNGAAPRHGGRHAAPDPGVVTETVPLRVLLRDLGNLGDGRGVDLGERPSGRHRK